jgi:DNA invertase Pin-like site-specific DNA recombinase
MILAAYTRRSTDEQLDSQATQERLIRAWCATNGHQLLRVYHEIPISGGKRGIERRPILHQLMTDVKRRDRDFQGLVVWMLDRLGREPGTEYVVIGILDDAHCPHFSVTEQIDRKTAAGRLRYHNEMGYRAYEREVTGERVYAHNQSRAMSGQWPAGLPPLGYEYDPAAETISISDRAPDAIAVFETWISSSGNASEAARRLNALGLTTRLGNPFRDDAVLTLVKSPIYRRQVAYDGPVYDAQALIPELIPPQLLAQADALLDYTAPLVKRQRAGLYAYSGVLRCSECGSRLRRHSGHDSDGWICSARKDSGLCISRRVSERYVDRLAAQAVGQLFRALQSDLVQSHPSHPSHTSHSADRRARLLIKRDRVLRLYIEGNIGDEDRRRYLAEIDADLRAVDRAPAVAVLDAERIRELVAAVPADWPTAPHDERHALLVAIRAEITLCTRRKTTLWLTLATALPLEPITVHATDHKR